MVILELTRLDLFIPSSGGDKNNYPQQTFIEKVAHRMTESVQLANNDKRCRR